MSTLQRYDMEAVSYSGAWVKEIPSEDGDWVKADEAIALKKRVEELEKAFETCHSWHNIPHICVDMVDKHYHELFSDAYNPHKHWSERK